MKRSYINRKQGLGSRLWNSTFGRVKTKRARAISEQKARRKAEIILRQNLKQQLIDEYGYICMTCHMQGDWRGISLSHKVPLSRGGKTTRANCLNECYFCHEKYEKHPEKRHGIRER